MKKNISGFTIVELLIVIVVIAILAAISIVAYSGIQQRARNAQTVSVVNAYQKTLMYYAGVNSTYPPHGYSCLGANYPSNQCWTGPNGTFSVNTTLDGLLEPYLGSAKPTAGSKPLQVTTTDQRMGALYIRTSPTVASIIYYLEGAGQSCLDGSVGVTEMQATQCTLQLPPA